MRNFYQFLTNNELRAIDIYRSIDPGLTKKHSVIDRVQFRKFLMDYETVKGEEVETLCTKFFGDKYSEKKVPLEQFDEGVKYIKMRYTKYSVIVGILRRLNESFLKQHLKSFNQVFRFFDENSDSVISKEEVERGTAKLGVRIPYSEFQVYLKVYELDDYGYIPREEFLFIHRYLLNFLAEDEASRVYLLDQPAGITPRRGQSIDTFNRGSDTPNLVMQNDYSFTLDRQGSAKSNRGRSQNSTYSPLPLSLGGEIAKAPQKATVVGHKIRPIPLYHFLLGEMARAGVSAQKKSVVTL